MRSKDGLHPWQCTEQVPNLVSQLCPVPVLLRVPSFKCFIFPVPTEDRSSDGDDPGFERISGGLRWGEGWLPGIGLSLGDGPHAVPTGRPRVAVPRGPPAVPGAGSGTGRMILLGGSLGRPGPAWFLGVSVSLRQACALCSAAAGPWGVPVLVGAPRAASPAWGQKLSRTAWARGYSGSSVASKCSLLRWPQMTGDFWLIPCVWQNCWAYPSCGSTRGCRQAATASVLKLDKTGTR